MIKKSFLSRLLVASCLSMALVIPSAEASERGRRGSGRGKERSHHEVVRAGHHRYHYRDGRFYHWPSWFGIDIAIGFPPVGAVVRVLPRGHRVFVSRGVRYYCYDDIYYTGCSSGYVVVPAPVVEHRVVYTSTAPAVQVASAGTVTINVPSANGGYEPVTLVRERDGYRGPQGEYYPGRPTVDQLRVLYGT